MQSQLYPTQSDDSAVVELHKTATDEQQVHPISPDHMQQDSPGKKKTVFGKIKDKAKDKARKLKRRVNKSSGTDHGNEEERSGSNSSSSSDNDEADSNEGQVDSNEPSYQNQILEKKGNDETLYTHEPRAAAEFAPSSEETYRRQEQVPAAPGQESTGVSAYFRNNPARESEGGYEAGSEKAIPQDTSVDTVKSGLGESEEKTDPSMGIQNEEKPFTDEKEIGDSLSSVPGEPGTEVATGVKPQRLTDRAYKGLGAAKGSIAAAAAAAVGALGYGGASSRRGEQQQELGTKDKATEGSTDKSYLDLAREKIGGVITGPPQSEKKEGPGGSTEDESSENVSSEASSTITGRALGTVRSFKDTIASKLGYGGAVTGEQEATSTPESTEASGEQKPYTRKLYETATGSRDVIASKLGYGGEKAESGEVASGEGKNDKKSYTQKLYETATGAKGVVASKLGYGGVGGKGEEISEGSDSNVVSEQQTRAEATAARFSPGEEDKALSQLITDVVSNSAATVKGTLLSPFSKGSSNSTTPSSTISTNSMTETTRGAEEDEFITSAPTSAATIASSPTARGQSKGIVDRVVSSILGKKQATEEKNGEEAVMPPSSDTTPQD